MARNVPGYFTPRPTIEYSEGYRFQQRGRRIYIESMETGEELTSFEPSWPGGEPKTWEPKYLTSKQLETAARRWLSLNPEFLGIAE